jgi:HSP20 family protein
MKLLKHNREKSGTLTPVSKPWSPFWTLRHLQEDVERLFDTPFGGWLAPQPGFFEGWGPPVDVYEDKNNVFVQVEIPGVKKDEIEVTMTEGLLHITGEQKEEAEFKDATSYRSERYFGRFHRSIPLPKAIDGKRIEAHFKDGVLKVTCPKTEEAKRKAIEVKID